MPDLFSDITKAPPDVLEAIVKTLELRAADPQLQRRGYGMARFSLQV